MERGHLKIICFVTLLFLQSQIMAFGIARIFCNWQRDTLNLPTTNNLYAYSCLLTPQQRPQGAGRYFFACSAAAYTNRLFCNSTPGNANLIQQLLLPYLSPNSFQTQSAMNINFLLFFTCVNQTNCHLEPSYNFSTCNNLTFTLTFNNTWTNAGEFLYISKTTPQNQVLQRPEIFCRYQQLS